MTSSTVVGDIRAAFLYIHIRTLIRLLHCQDFLHWGRFDKAISDIYGLLLYDRRIHFQLFPLSGTGGRADKRRNGRGRDELSRYCTRKSPPLNDKAESVKNLAAIIISWWPLKDRPVTGPAMRSEDPR